MWSFTVIRTLTAITRALQSICNCLACCVVITHLTMYTHYPSSTIILSIIQIQSSTWTTSVVIILCVCVSPPPYDRYRWFGLFCLPRRWKYLCRRIVSGHSTLWFAHRPLKHTLDYIFGFMLLISWSHCSLIVIWVLAFSDKRLSNCFIWDSIPIERDQSSFCKAVTHCCWLEGTLFSASQ